MSCRVGPRASSRGAAQALTCHCRATVHLSRAVSCLDRAKRSVPHTGPFGLSRLANYSLARVRSSISTSELGMAKGLFSYEVGMVKERKLIYQTTENWMRRDFLPRTSLPNTLSMFR